MEQQLKKKKMREIAVVLLRLLASAVCFVATIVMVTIRDSVTIFSITMEAKFQYTPAFKYFVAVNALSSSYGLLVSFVSLMASCLRSMVASMDLLAVLHLTSSAAAAVAIGQVAKHGNMAIPEGSLANQMSGTALHENVHSGWKAVCPTIPKYCNQVTGALVGNFIGAVLYTADNVFHSVESNQASVNPEKA